MLEACGISGIVQNPRFEIGGEIVRPDVFIKPLNLVCQVGPDWHLADPIAREDRIKIALYQAAGYSTLSIPGEDLGWGVRHVLDRWNAQQDVAGP